MNTFENIMTRRSTRKYLDQPVSQELLEKIIKEKAYKKDYDSLTTQLLEENVPYDTVIAALKKVAESSIFENN